jgi:hypothetical protein
MLCCLLSERSLPMSIHNRYFNDNNDGNETNLAATPTGVADPPSNSTSALMDDSVFAFPNDLDPADIINSRRLVSKA